MFGLCLMEASDKHAGLPASKRTPDSVCSRENEHACDNSFLLLPLFPIKHLKWIVSVIKKSMLNWLKNMFWVTTT